MSWRFHVTRKLTAAAPRSLKSRIRGDDEKVLRERRILGACTAGGAAGRARKRYHLIQNGKDR